MTHKFIAIAAAVSFFAATAAVAATHQAFDQLAWGYNQKQKGQNGGGSGGGGSSSSAA